MTLAPRIVAVVGVTAAGKTEVGEAIARRVRGEVVCADSRQVFAELEIGTGKPAREVRGHRPHHLFEALHLGERPSAGWYAHAAAAACSDIHARGAVPVLVGGSGLYVRALQKGLSSEPPTAPEIRARLRDEAAREGAEAMHRRLTACDPELAARLAPRDLQRVSRALEVYESSGRPLSWWQGQPPRSPIEAEWQVIEITAEPRALDLSIARRTRAMFDGGLVEEVAALLERGLAGPLAELAAVGYDETVALIEGRCDRETAEARTNLRTRQLAKRQRTWFRHQIEATRFAAGERDPEVLAREITGID